VLRATKVILQDKNRYSEFVAPIEADEKKKN